MINILQDSPKQSAGRRERHLRIHLHSNTGHYEPKETARDSQQGEQARDIQQGDSQQGDSQQGARRQQTRSKETANKEQGDSKQGGPRRPKGTAAITALQPQGTTSPRMLMVSSRLFIRFRYVCLDYHSRRGWLMPSSCHHPFRSNISSSLLSRTRKMISRFISPRTPLSDTYPLGIRVSTLVSSRSPIFTFLVAIEPHIVSFW